MAIYLIKINVALMLLYGFYRLTVSRDTFFGLRRLTLWLIYAVALMVPALNLEYWVRDTPTMAGMANVYADTFYPVVVVKAQGSQHNLDGYAAGHLLGRSCGSLIAFGMAALQHHPPCGYFPEAGGGRHYGTSSQRRGESVLLLPLGVYVSIYPGGQAVARSDGSRVHPCFGSPFPGYPLLRAFLHRLLV